MIVTITLNPSFDKSITINNFRAGAVNKIKDMRIDAGGKGINVSKVLNELRCDNIAVGIAGSDNWDDYERFLKEMGIRYKFITTNGCIRTNIKINDPASGTTTDINEPGPTLKEYDLAQLKSLLSKYEESASVFVISGSISPDTSSTFIARLVEFLTKMGKKVIVDTSGEALRYAVKARPYIIKPNIDELSELIGKSFSSRDEIIASAKELVQSGIHGVMVTMGGDGLLYVTKNSIHYSPGIKVAVKCTVGAGDAVTAGIAKLTEIDDSDDMIVYTAASLGAAAVGTEGSKAPRLDDIIYYNGMVEVIEL